MPFCPILRHVLALIAMLSGCGRFSASTKIHWPKRQLTEKSSLLIGFYVQYKADAENIFNINPGVVLK